MKRSTEHAILQSPEIIRNFLIYSETVKGKSPNSIEEYYHDLTVFFKFIIPQKVDIKFTDENEIDLNLVTIDLIKKITVSDLHAFLVHCRHTRNNNSSTRARKASTLRIFFKYLTNNVHLIEINPAEQLDTPKLKKSLPIHLTLEESLKLLNSVDGPFKERDYCILVLFLNCGLRLSELCRLNYTDIHDDGSMRILGKGNKERIVYLNDACINAVKEYMKVRPADGLAVQDKYALFLSKRRQRISNKTVQYIVKSTIEKAGLQNRGFSTHKLRHTAATLMYQQGGVDIRVLKEILGHENLGTTQIYTHVANEQIKNAINSNPLADLKPKKKKEDLES